ncbi:MAG: MoxR-like ATPase [Candidatus Sumerlaeota bacterium]|nr:MoxR-like ATPase [Candidatus Sumerlaeota bacterium]
MSQTAQIEGIELHLAHPDDVPARWIGSERVREQLIAAWMVVEERDIPLNPRLIGKPGVGKTTLAYSVAKELGQEVYIVQCTMDTRPEDLLVTPVIAGAGQIAYHASPLVTAMVRGGICILDEGNRMSEKSWASLAPLLDMRRYVESVVAGLKVKAHADFRICVTMNDDASTYEIPEYIQSRLQPQIEVTFPNRAEELEILRFNVPFAEETVLEYVADFLQKAHGVNLPFSSRDGVNILRYAIKMGKRRGEPPETFLAEGIEAILGADGVGFLDSGIPADRMRGAHGTLRELDDEEYEELEDFFDDEDEEDGEPF